MMVDLDHIRELVGKYLEGIADEAETEELKKVLEQSPAAAALFAEETRMHSRLDDYFNEEPAIHLTAPAKKRKPGSSRFKRRARKSSGPWKVLIPIAAVIAIAVGLLVYGPQSAEEGPFLPARISQTGQGAQIIREGRPRAAEEDQRLMEGDIVSSGAVGTVIISYDQEATSITLDPESSLEVNAADGAKELSLHYGALACRAGKQPAGKPLIVKTDHGRAEVVGTAFRFHKEQTYTRLGVSEGLVRLTRESDGQSLNVPAGNYALAGKDVELALRPLEGSAPEVQVRAGADEILMPENTVSLKAQVTDMDLPHEELAFTWRKISGAGAVRFSKAGDLETDAVFSRSGTYVLALEAADGMHTGRGTISIAVKPQRAYGWDFDAMTAGQWPAGWEKHAEAGTRSGFRVQAEPGSPDQRFVTVPGPVKAGTTQHAFIPIRDWTGNFTVSFRMRVKGPDTTRAGIEFEDGVDLPSFEYDITKQVFRADWPRGTAIREIPLKIKAGEWMTISITVTDIKQFKAHINGREVMDIKLDFFDRHIRTSLVSKGSDSAEFDDVKVINRE